MTNPTLSERLRTALLTDDSNIAWWFRKNATEILQALDDNERLKAELRKSVSMRINGIEDDNERYRTTLDETREFIATCVGQFDPQLPDNAGSKVAEAVHSAAYSLLVKLNTFTPSKTSGTS